MALGVAALVLLAGCSAMVERHQVEVVTDISATGEYEVWLPVPLDAHSAKKWAEATQASTYFGAADAHPHTTDKGATVRVTGNGTASLEARFQGTCCFDGFNKMKWSTAEGLDVWIWASKPLLVSINYVGTSCQGDACDGGSGTTCWIEGRVSGHMEAGWNRVPAPTQRGCD